MTLHQDFVDLLAVRQGIVEIHRADDGTQVGRGQVDDGVLQMAHLVGGAGDASSIPGKTPRHRRSPPRCPW
jgi:uracil phosphoribosyltransferase